MKKILIVEDEEKLRNELKIFLETNGYEVLLITNFSNTKNDILNTTCDLILLDINLPSASGEYICKELRKDISTPIIIVTSRNNELDELLCINYGADDFITKPYNAQILLARINRLLTRDNNNQIIKYEDLTIDLTSSSIKKDNELLDLTKNEIKILYYLVSNKGNIISREDLMDFLWGTDEFIDDNTLTVNVNRLRSKLESFGYKDLILTRRGEGYIIL